MRAKTFFAVVLAVIAACAPICVEAKPLSLPPSPAPKPGEWLETRFGKNGVPPFSFKYGGRDSATFIRNWDLATERKELDANRIQHVYTYTDPATRLQIRAEAIEYRDFPALEWVLRIKNDSDADSPLLEDIQALDTSFHSATNGNFVLHHALGADLSRADFAPVDTPLNSLESIRFTPNGGRPSDIQAFPFFNLEDKQLGGTMIAIGWSGRWAATFSRVDEKSVNAKAGMALTRLKLYPHEEFRTPRIMLLFWRGDDYLTGQNALRRILLAHYSPQKDGKAARLPFSISVHGTYVFNETTEKNMAELAKAAAERFKKIGFEYFWIDAGWYEGGWPNGVGNFFADPKRFPNGLGPVGRAAAENGYKFLLWIEPERVHQGTQMYAEHPKWVLKNDRYITTSGNGLLNLGNEDARRWLTDKISEIIETGGIGIYRQDFNMDPIKYWLAADKPDRRGMTEIRYVEGLYKFWDELLSRHPGLMIDNCASGGRRLDLETVSRSVALWRTDYAEGADGSDTSLPTGYQAQTYALSLWLPTHSTGSSTLDRYTFRSAMTNGIVMSWNPLKADLPLETAESLAAEFKRAREFCYGDFYPLSPHTTAIDTWMAYQFQRDDLGGGMVLAFRREQAPDSSIVVRLKGLSPDAKYELDYSGKNTKKTVSGKELMSGLKISLDNPRESELIFYKKK